MPSWATARAARASCARRSATARTRSCGPVPLTSQETQSHAEAFFAARPPLRGRARRRRGRRAPARRRVAEIDGLGPLFSGKYYLSEVRHLFDGMHGIRTEFTGRASRPRPGAVGSQQTMFDASPLHLLLAAQGPTGLGSALVRRLPGPGHRHQGSGRAGPREGHAALVARHRRRALRGLGAAGHDDGRQQPRHLVRPGRRRRGAGRLRGRRSAPAVRGRRPLERPGPAAGVDGRRPATNDRKVLRSRNGVKVTLDDQGRPGEADPGDARRPEDHAEGRAGRRRDRRQQRQLGEAAKRAGITVTPRPR